MPSPRIRIPITLNPSTWFLPVEGAESQAFLPPSIEVGEVATLSEELKVFIKTNEMPPSPGSQFFEQDTLSISAHMPWLNRTLPSFEYSKLIHIQYPIALQGFDFLKSLAQDSESHFDYEVGRAAEVLLSVLSIPPRSSTRVQEPWDQSLTSPGLWKL